jgi:aryl carrier-like protein
VVSTLRRDEPGLLGLLDALGQAYVHGANPDWEAVTGTGGRFTAPPLYPWRRTRFRAVDAVPNVPADLLPAVVDGAPRTELIEGSPTALGPGVRGPYEAAENPADVLAGLRATLAEVLALDPAQLEPTTPLTRYGLDSVLAMDLSRRILRRYGVTIPVKTLLQGGTLEELAGQAAPVAAAL